MKYYEYKNPVRSLPLVTGILRMPRPEGQEGHGAG